MPVPAAACSRVEAPDPPPSGTTIQAAVALGFTATMVSSSKAGRGGKPLGSPGSAARVIREARAPPVNERRAVGCQRASANPAHTSRSTGTSPVLDRM